MRTKLWKFYSNCTVCFQFLAKEGIKISNWNAWRRWIFGLFFMWENSYSSKWSSVLSAALFWICWADQKFADSIGNFSIFYAYADMYTYWKNRCVRMPCTIQLQWCLCYFWLIFYFVWYYMWLDRLWMWQITAARKKLPSHLINDRTQAQYSSPEENCP